MSKLKQTKDSVLITQPVPDVSAQKQQFHATENFNICSEIKAFPEPGSLNDESDTARQNTTSDAPETKIKKGIDQWPEMERPRERLLNLGPSYLSESELLAMVLRNGTKSLHAVDLAKDLLMRFGSLRHLFSATRVNLCKTSGIGNAKAAELIAVGELFKRLAREELQAGDKFNSAEKCRHYFQSVLRDKKQEHFVCLLLTQQLKFLAYEEVFHGNINSAPVYVGEIVRLILDYNAACVVVAHNHPSGDPSPSDADRKMTQKLKETLALIDVKLVDHVIVGANETVSLAEQGML